MRSPVAKNLYTYNKPKVEEHSKQELLEKALDLEVEEAYYGRYSSEYSLGDVGCGSISIEDAD